ncbi:DUF6544 family protein [Maritalea sp. S77]|uniref:DUF6544 family protein n=1 Tax=Maritalea sp. S77 TaxID=3415125 RepID=UPI003C7B397E
MTFKLSYLWLLPLTVLFVAALAFYARNIADKWQVAQLTAHIAESPVSAADVYDPHMVADLPEAAQRYFNFSLRTGAPLKQNLRLTMEGQLGLGNAEHPNYFPFGATQTIVPDRGFTWVLHSKGLPMVISGSDMMWDNQSWTRFWLYGLVPVARMGGSEDHFKSAEGRLLVELAAWNPAALLPQNGVEWTQEGQNVARAWITTSTGRHWVDIRLKGAGVPMAYEIARWSNANPKGVYQPQPFGGTPLKFTEIGGITIASQVDVGNHFGTADYFPFFRATLTEIEFF